MLCELNRWGKLFVKPSSFSKEKQKLKSLTPKTHTYTICKIICHLGNISTSAPIKLKFSFIPKQCFLLNTNKKKGAQISVSKHPEIQSWK